jgi:ubiquinone/menaquinone biosynthesis C-methylase UbiE
MSALAFARIPEPELMEDLEQARAYSEANFAAPHDRCVELFRASWPAGPISGRLLDLGCGPADITVRLALACPEVTIDGVDGSAAMLHFGQRRVDAAGLSHRVHLCQAFLPDEPPPGTDYDIIVSSSLLHHLHHPQVLWRYLARYARLGARVFVFDLMRPASPEQARALVQTYAADEPEILQRDFYNSLCAAFTKAEVEAQLTQVGLFGLTVEEVSDRHLTVRGVIQGRPIAGA